MTDKNPQINTAGFLGIKSDLVLLQTIKIIFL